MSILFDQSSRVIVQGITGREGQFHTKNCLGILSQCLGENAVASDKVTLHSPTSCDW